MTTTTTMNDPKPFLASASKQEIAAALKAQHGIEVDKRKLEQEEPIKKAGQSFVTLKLYPGISTRMIVNVKVTTK